MQISLLHSGTRRHKDSTNAVFKLKKEGKTLKSNTTLWLLLQQLSHMNSTEW